MQDFRKIIQKEDVFIIAEIGVNYYDIASKEKISPIEAAKLMITSAKEGGAHAVKFQTYKAEKLASRNSPAYWDLTEEPITNQYELFKKFDSFGESEYKELADFCKVKNIIFMSTPFDFEAVDYLDYLVPIFKISSSDITNIPFIQHVASKKKPIFLSTGASTIGEIETAVNTIISENNNDISIIHCVLDYPTEFKNANLNMIKCLKSIFPKFLIGYSDHSKPDDSMLIPTLAYVYGASIIEKHFTLDKSLKGNDHYHAMDIEDLKKLKNNINLIREISGEYFKRPLECEQKSRIHARRSIVATQPIKKGKKITRKDITFKRPGTGIPPSFFMKVLNAEAIEDIEEDEILTFKKLRFLE
ncbi:MAG: N-acetylneuraminate synthase family protein [Promethearchaeota archaeon]